jgi:hypothetical protein
MISAELAAALLLAVQSQQFQSTPDRLRQGAPVEVFPSIDVAVIAFPSSGTAVGANVFFSRDHPHGRIAEFTGPFGSVHNVHFLADQRDAAGNSTSWLPGADWDRLTWRTLGGRTDQPRFVAPYPASLVKLMVLVGIALEVDSGRTTWSAPWAYRAETLPVRAWAERMIAVSSNDATSALVALLHQLGAIVRTDGAERHNRVHDAFARYGLTTLRLAQTRPDGGWMNRDGAGVGELQMTAWDTARLLWLLDEAAPPPLWLEAGTPPLLTDASRAEVRALLASQALHEVLSSTAVAGVPGWRPGIPARVPERWITPEGGVVAFELKRPPDIRAAQSATEVQFDHKTGTTENFLSDAGIVVGITPQRRHYIIALLSNLGTRYAPAENTTTTWKVPQLGAAIDAWLEARLEPKNSSP